MKKWWILPIVAVVFTVTLFVKKEKGTGPEAVRTTVLQPQKAEQTISCNGVVEAGEIEAVFSSQTCVVDKVQVTVGQQVQAGDTLVTIDKEATKQLQQGSDRLSVALPLTTMSNSVTAPVDGVVLSVEVADGGMLDQSIPCVTIAPTACLQVRVLIREKQLPSLEVGQRVRISGVGFDKEVYHGSLKEISGAASASGNEGVVEGVVCLDQNEADDSMRIGLSAKVKVVVSTVEEGLLIPYEAVVYDEDESYVYFWQDGKVLKQCVEPLNEYTGGVLVDQMQWAGKTLILEPNKVSDGNLNIQVLQEATE